jgi:hypothetical protein
MIPDAGLMLPVQKVPSVANDFSRFNGLITEAPRFKVIIEFLKQGLGLFIEMMFSPIFFSSLPYSS